MERVLVTGCGGFVGSIMSAALAADGVDVWGVDRTDVVDGFAGANYSAADLNDAQQVQRVLADAAPTHIVHLAAQSSAARSFDVPVETIQDNTLPLLNMLEYLRTHAPQTRVVAVGSAEVYGPAAPDDMPLAETRYPNPVNPYAVSKAMQERGAQMYARLYDSDVVLTRSFNHTGAGQSDTFVLPSFARQVVEIQKGMREAVVEVGNIDVRRDFSDVRDVVQAYRLLLTNGARGEIYNVCSGKAYSIRDLLERLARLADTRIEIRVDPERVRPVETQELRGDNARIKQDTGWQPQFDIDETLAWLIEDWSRRVSD